MKTMRKLSTELNVNKNLNGTIYFNRAVGSKGGVIRYGRKILGYAENESEFNKMKNMIETLLKG